MKLEDIYEAKANGQRIGFTCSAFDLLHAGHVAMLAEAKVHCDVLIVGLLSDPTIDRPGTKHAPVQSMFERWMQLQAVSYVDGIIPFGTEKDLVDMLLVIKPDIRFVGEEYANKPHTGRDLPIEIYYNGRAHSFSSSELRTRVKEA